ncbi:helix-turn-helix domain-containing protein [Rhodanobacter glycinis]|jgi:transcriptional regulator with XRE-family HTH domain|uniref:Helix-turn-helix domain-containing protein n=1 Tax=Rhodanobacter glycinis TaxID=582702 RepID=A0A1I4A2T9_9GAMM|nr:helix-turn-helix domain-containing protein [Rhodanobacter glycinis]SFK50417.1 Helix-turn-helix domain-containing protein [Rhodanobacter glycinis]
MKIDKKAFADRLRAALKHERIEASASELVRLLELQGEQVSSQAVSGWLNGKHRPRPAHMEALAKVVGVEPHELEYRVTRSRGVQDVNIAWPDHVRGHDRLAFEDYLQLSDEKRKLVRELIAELAKGAPGKLR